MTPAGRERPISKRRPTWLRRRRGSSWSPCAFRDPSDAGTQPRGKQRLKSGGIWYTAQSGIWQPVWMEVVPARRVLALALHPDADAGILTADVDVSGDAGLVRIYVCDPTGRQVGAGAAFAEEGSVPVGV